MQMWMYLEESGQIGLSESICKESFSSIESWKPFYVPEREGKPAVKRTKGFLVK